MSRIPIRILARSKYHAKREGKYASKKEARRAGELAILVKLGAIFNLREQVRYELIPADELGRAIVYVADFVYEEHQNEESVWQFIVEDVKGVKTPLYKLKKRLMWKIYHIRIREV